MGTELNRGTVIARRYRLERLIGEGGMGSVWAATHLVTRRMLAMKFVRGPVHLKPELRRRFLREARAASAVNHPNVVQIHDVFELDDDTPVMVMDLLEGETLAQRVARERKLSLAETAALMLPVVSAVGTAHARGVVHRDLKPDNVFLARTEDSETVVKVLDFGIAKLTLDANDSDEGLLTGTGTALGTPCYMAPEQCFGDKDVDHRADIWALGVMLYELLSGCRPIEGDSVGHVVKIMMTSPITPLEVVVPSIPRNVAALVMRMLAREKESRPATLLEVQELLAKFTPIKVRSFAEPASIRALSVDRDPSVPEIHAEALLGQVNTSVETLAPIPSTDETIASQPAPSRVAVELGIPSTTTTGAHAVPRPKAAAGPFWALAAIAIVGFAALVMLIQKPDVPAPDSRAPSARPNAHETARPNAVDTTRSRTATAAPIAVAAPLPQPPPASASAPLASISAPAASSAPPIGRSAPAARVKAGPPGVPGKPARETGVDLFDDRK